MPELTTPYAGCSTRSGPLSCGHANIVRSISVDDDPTRLNLAMVFDAPAEGGLDRIADQVRRLVERHESLRTTYRLGTPVTQDVAGSGEITIELAEADGDPLDTAEDLARRLRARVFDLENEPPYRVAVVSHDGAPRHVVWVVTHAALDVAACEVLHLEWAALSNDRALPAAARLEPIDVVELENTAALKRVGAASLRYWAGRLDRVPQAMFTPSWTTPAKTDWRHEGLCIRSATIPAALEKIAERTGASPSAVVLTALAVLVGYRTTHDTVVITSLSGNRVVRKLKYFFGSLAQDALLPVDLGGLSTFDEAVRQVRSAALPAYRHSWFEPTAIWQVINGVTGARGISFARDLVFNDMSLLATSVESPEQSARSRLPGVWIPGHQAAAVDDLEIGGSLTWLPPEDIPCRFFACLYRLDGEFELTLWVDPQILPKDEAHELGRSLLALLHSAARADLPLDDLAALTGLSPVERGAGWLRSDQSWIELDAVRDLMAGVLGDVPHLVTAEQSERLGHRVVCHVAAPADPEDLHERAVAALGGRVTSIAPQLYLVHPAAPAPDRRSDVDAWSAIPAVGRSTGRPQGREDV